MGNLKIRRQSTGRPAPEQAYQPSLGKVVVDSIILDRSVQLFSEKTGIPRLYVEEVSEKYVKPRLDSLRFAIDEVGK